MKSLEPLTPREERLLKGVLRYIREADAGEREGIFIAAFESIADEAEGRAPSTKNKMKPTIPLQRAAPASRPSLDEKTFLL